MAARILLIDDEPNVLSSLRRALTGQGCEILLAGSGPEALDILAQTEVAVIICDQRLPGMSGPQILAESIKLRPDAIRIALTQHADLKIAQRSINEGRVSHFLLKPWDNQHLRTVVREGVRRYELQQEIRRLHEVTSRQRDDLQQWSRLLERKVLERTEALHTAHEEMLDALVLALDSREHRTGGHSRRVAVYCLYLALEVGLAPEKLEDLYRGALLHDIGKIGVPDTVLLKPGSLSEKERTIIEQHVVIGHRVLQGIGYLKHALAIPRYHHERFDGTGYVERFAGTAIPLEARIFAVVDVYDALRSHRPYKDAMPHDQAFAIIADEAGTHFDPAIASTFLRIAKETWDSLARSAAKVNRFDRALAACGRIRADTRPRERSAAA
ncbi:MAG: response regulator [Planctomycetes bacterium]|nr:response regulator [Planctomycetota bacterium]